MAAISIINNGEAMSSVRSKLNNVITEVNLLDPTDWIDYSETSTIEGWSSFTTKTIRYRIIGKQMFFEVFLLGTSNSTSATFTLPNNNININNNYIPKIINNGVVGIGLSDISANSNSFTTYSSSLGNIFTNSGTKLVSFQGFIEIA